MWERLAERATGAGSPDEGHIVLGYRAGAPDRHFQVSDVPLSEVADALSQWMNGDRRFIDDHERRRLSV